MKLSNEILKWLALLVACGWLYAYWDHKAVGRYTTQYFEPNFIVTDTASGIVWVGIKSGDEVDFVEIHPKDARGIQRKLKITRE